MIQYIWLVLLVIFLIVEAACPIHLVSLWFALGSLIAMLAAMAGISFGWQVALFILVSAGLLACLWPLTRKFLNPRVSATNVDAVIGSIGIVTSPIDNIEAVGEVKLSGMPWTARSTSGDPLPAGIRVKVDRIEGVKAFVSPVTETVQV